MARDNQALVQGIIQALHCTYPPKLVSNRAQTRFKSGSNWVVPSGKAAAKIPWGSSGVQTECNIVQTGLKLRLTSLDPPPLLCNRVQMSFKSGSNWVDPSSNRAQIGVHIPEPLPLPAFQQGSNEFRIGLRLGGPFRRGGGIDSLGIKWGANRVH